MSTQGPLGPTPENRARLMMALIDYGRGYCLTAGSDPHAELMKVIDDIFVGPAPQGQATETVVKESNMITQQRTVVKIRSRFKHAYVSHHEQLPDGSRLLSIDYGGPGQKPKEEYIIPSDVMKDTYIDGICEADSKYDILLILAQKPTANPCTSPSAVPAS